MSTPGAVIFGSKGPVLSERERAFFKEADPWGFIVFARNIENPDQLAALTQSYREAVGRDAPILIDQEGGRVQRLRPPHWRSYPTGAAYGALYSADPEKGLEAARLGARLIAGELARAGVTVDCLPVLDVPVPGAHDVIGDRAYGLTPEPVIALGRAACEGLLQNGVLPIIKHIPGHGRAGVDSHEALPVVDAPLEVLQVTDFAPFRALADMPLAMTAHVIYSAIDAEAPATTSSKVIAEVIRGNIGFDGLLMSDDLSMKALGGDFGARTRASFAAGCDMVLHCNGDPGEMEAIMAEVPRLGGKALLRAENALGRYRPPQPFDEEAGWEAFQALIGNYS